ncbi:TIGR03564 family F420-dependent LLM class oxidoreductase [Amycolatopsis methanolica]|nr:TIGR03564 family F420-dependent LLM class oxidoreductase [Amycolatopsis methanolica]
MVDDTGKTIDDIVTAARSGLPALWLGQRFGWDPLTALAVAGREVPGIELGTAIVPTWPQHPITLATRALSTQSATGNRLSLGVGLSHPVMVEGQYGLPYDRPARHLREYLSALGPLLSGETVAHQGETLTARARVEVAGATPPALLVSALGDRTLRVAGELADGTITTWAGPRTLGEHIVPKIRKAAAGRAEPRVVAGVVVAVTDDPDGIRAWVTRGYTGSPGRCPRTARSSTGRGCGRSRRSSSPVTRAWSNGNSGVSWTPEPPSSPPPSSGHRRSRVGRWTCCGA